MEDVKVREMQIFDYKKKIAEAETKLKQQQVNEIFQFVIFHFKYTRLAMFIYTFLQFVFEGFSSKFLL